MTKINNYLKRFEACKNGDLDYQERSVFDEDLKKDPEMKKAWKEYSSIMEALSDKEAISLRELLENIYNKSFNKHLSLFSKTKWLKAAAAAITIIATGTLLYFFCAHNNHNINFNHEALLVKNDTGDVKITTDTILLEHPNQNVKNIDKTQILEKHKPHEGDKKNEIASIYEREEYQINPVYKELLSSVYRGNWFEIITPEDSVILGPGENLVFSWETNISDSIYFDILDRNGKVIYKHSTAIHSPWTFEQNLAPAIYMYRFSTAEEPLWLGVIVEKQ
jgi:hypothetical protein